MKFLLLLPVLIFSIAGYLFFQPKPEQQTAQEFLFRLKSIHKRLIPDKMVEFELAPPDFESGESTLFTKKNTPVYIACQRERNHIARFDRLYRDTATLPQDCFMLIGTCKGCSKKSDGAWLHKISLPFRKFVFKDCVSLKSRKIIEKRIAQRWNDAYVSVLIEPQTGKYCVHDILIDGVRLTYLARMYGYVSSPQIQNNDLPDFNQKQVF